MFQGHQVQNSKLEHGEDNSWKKQFHSGEDLKSYVFWLKAKDSKVAS